MTAKELAALIDGRQAGRELTATEEQQAAESGLAVLYAPRADFAMISGAIKGQLLDAANYGQKIYITHDGFLMSRKCSDEDCPFFRAAVKMAVNVDAEFCTNGDPYCTFTADIPHDTFRTYIGGGAEVYCVGIIFNVEDLPGGRNVPL